MIEMQMSEICKQSLGVIHKVDEVLTSLAEQAKELLGYDVLQKHTGRVHAVEMTPLQLALKGLEIEILNKSDVKKYQKEKMVEETLKRASEWAKNAADYADLPSPFSGSSWTRTMIDKYREPIPEFVISKAIQVKKAFPDCQIVIEHLSDYPDPFLLVEIPNPRYDWMPGEEGYYIEVWEELKFEGHLRNHSGESEIPF